MGANMQNQEKAKNQYAENAFHEMIDRVKRKGEELQSLTGELYHDVSEINEIVEAARKLESTVPQAINYEMQIGLLEGIEKRYDDGVRKARRLQNTVSVARGLSYMSTTSGSVTIGNISEAGLIDAEMVLHVREYENVVSRPTIQQGINDLLLKWGFNTARSGKQSPYEKFNNAHSQYELDKLSHLSLIEMRECIKLIIETLLLKRPFQEPTTNEGMKIKSICFQLQRNGLERQFVLDLAEQWHDLDNSLSVGKQSDLSKDEIRRKLAQATTFIGSLLMNLDLSKVKKPRRKRNKTTNNNPK